jgi:hypothetical protein
VTDVFDQRSMGLYSAATSPLAVFHHFGSTDLILTVAGFSEVAYMYVQFTHLRSCWRRCRLILIGIL